MCWWPIVPLIIANWMVSSGHLLSYVRHVVATWHLGNQKLVLRRCFFGRRLDILMMPSAKVAWGGHFEVLCWFSEGWNDGSVREGVFIPSTEKSLKWKLKITPKRKGESSEPWKILQLYIYTLEVQRPILDRSRNGDLLRYFGNLFRIYLHYTQNNNIWTSRIYLCNGKVSARCRTTGSNMVD